MPHEANSNFIRVCSALLLALLLPIGKAYAADSCNAYLFPQSVSEVALARVRVNRLPVLQDLDGCAGAGNRCESKAYLVNGNEVLIAAIQGEYRCIAYFNGKRQTTGWVANEGLAPMPARSSQVDWAGSWKRVQGDAVMTIRMRSREYVASGLATYAVGPDNVRTGSADGSLQITSAAVASLTQNGDDPTSTCKVTMKQVGLWLLINDGATDDANSGCGGMGVTFNGIYQRVQTRAATRATP